MRTQIIIVLVSLGLLGGCGGTQIKETPDSSAPTSSQSSKGLDRLAAYDFVNVLVQVDGYNPDYAKLQMMQPDNQFGHALKRVLREANYDVETVENLSDAPFVDYSVENHENQTSTYALSVGQVFLERDYITMDNGEVQANSDLLIEGVDASLLSLQDSQPYKLHVPAKQPPEPTAVPVVLESVPLASDIGQSADLPEQSVVKQAAIEPENSITYRDPSFIILVNGDENPPSYSEGETLVFTLQAQRDARVSCYFQDPDANVMRMYPNSFVSSANVAAGEAVHIPSNDQWSVHATRAGSKDEVLCVSVEPEHELAMEEFDSSPDFEVLAYRSLDELLVNLSTAIGIKPETRRVSINAY